MIFWQPFLRLWRGAWLWGASVFGPALVRGTRAPPPPHTFRCTQVIAHRLSTIKDANMICVIEDGEIVEQVPHS